MSAVPADIGFEDAVGESGLEPELPRRATFYFWIVVAAATAATAPFLVDIQTVDAGAWITFAVLGAAVAVAQVFVVVTPANQSYHTTVVFLVASALLLPPELIALMAVVQRARSARESSCNRPAANKPESAWRSAAVRGIAA